MGGILTVRSTHYIACILGIVALCVKYLRTRERACARIFSGISYAKLCRTLNISKVLCQVSPVRKCRILEIPLFFLPHSPDRAVGNLFLAGGVCGIIQNPDVSPRTCRSLRRNARSVVGVPSFFEFRLRENICCKFNAENGETSGIADQKKYKHSFIFNILILR